MLEQQGQRRSDQGQSAMALEQDVVAVVMRRLFALTPRRGVKSRQIMAVTKPSSLPEIGTDPRSKGLAVESLMHQASACCSWGSG
ncbi:MAG: hypothetical protein N3Z29_08225 [Synechococcaceae cyanobacterium MAG-AL1]|nr:hypothetical protein [Candidatus Regnicoccus frigidus MAG-AL1]